MALEKWISEYVFRNDLSRVFLASNEYAFRRRFELTDMSRNFKDIDISSLKFPFANYWPLNTQWSFDERFAALNAQLIYKGIYENDTNIKAMPSTITIPAVFYFDREDDARLAYEIIYFKSLNEHYHSIEVPYSNSTLQLPVNIKVQDIKFNPDFKENDWLKNNRIFTLYCSFFLRSYVISPPLQPDYDKTLDTNGYLSDGSLYYDGIENYYLVEDVILHQKNFNDLYTSILTVSGSLQDSSIRIDKLYVSEVNTHSAKVSWEFSKDEEISKICINLAGKPEHINIAPSKKFYKLDNLLSNSNYVGYITFYNKLGSSKKLSFMINTLPSIDQIQSEVLPKDSLIGFKW